MIKKIQLLLIFSLHILIINGQTSKFTLGNIKNDTTWSSDTIRIYNDIAIHDSATLTILPGTYVEFQGNFAIEVSGIIKALGTLNDSITFTINDTTSFNDTTTVAGGWRGLRFLPIERNDTSFFYYCNFKYGKAVKPGLAGIEFTSEENIGGCIYAYSYPNIILRNSSFINNRSNYRGGAVHIELCDYTEITECHFENNFTFMYGGGVSIIKAAYFIISKNLFYKNTAYRIINNTGITGSGSGVYVSLGTTTGTGDVMSNKFFNNKSVNGAFYENCLNINVFNNIVANNEGVGMAQALGLVYNSLYVNNTIVNNWGEIVSALWFHTERSKMGNNIIWGNESAPYFGYQLYNEEGKTADISYSCIMDGYVGEKNIDVYPEFVNPTAGAGLSYDALNADWSLLNNSPCINAGTPDTTGLNLPNVDIEGRQRIYGIAIDMGAYENQVIVGLQQNSLVSSSIKITPNPFKNRFSVYVYPENKINSITIRNQTGITVKEMKQLPISGLFTVDMQTFSSGLYVIIIEYDNGTIEIKKMLKV